MKLPFARQDATPISRHPQAAVDRLAGRLGPAAEKVASVITRQRAVTWTFLLFGLTFLVWLPALSTYFYLDDFPWLRRYVTDPLPALEGVKEAFLPSTAAFTYRPTAFPFWRVGGLFFGEDPVGYHALNLLMIAGSGALLTVIARQLKLSHFVAYAAGFIYVVHPALFSNAFWIATVNDNMANMFSLAAVAFALGADKRSWLWLPGYLSFVLALLSKESAVVVPFLLAGIYVIRWWTREEALTRRSWPALGFFALLLGFVVLRSLPQVGAPWSAGDPRYEQSLFGTHIIKNSLSYAILFWRPIVPQAEIFQERFLDIWNANPFGLLLGAALGMALLLLGVRSLVKRERGVFLIGWAWLALGLLPAIPYTVRALDHYASLALVGFALLAAAAIALLAKPLRFAVLSIFLVLGVFYVYDRQDEHWVASGQALAENTATTLKQELPSTSEGMAIMLFWSDGGSNPALQALGGHNGPQVLYDDPDLVVFNGNGLSCKEGSLWAPEGRKGVERPVDPENTATFLAGEEGVVSIPIEEVFPANQCQYQLLPAIPSATFDSMLTNAIYRLGRAP